MNEMPCSLVTAKEAAKLLGVCQDTLRKLAKDGKIYREPRNVGSPFYLYDSFSFLSSMDDTTRSSCYLKETVFYCREDCDGKLKKGFLHNQVNFAKKLYPDVDVLSGNADDIAKDPVFDTLMNGIITGKVGKIIIFGKNTLTPLNIRYFKLFLSRFGVEVVDLNIYTKLVRDINTPSFKNFNDSIIPDKIIKTPAFHRGITQETVYVSSKDAASILGVHRKTVINRANKGLIAVYKVPGSSVVRYGVLNKVLENNSKRNIFYYLREKNIDVMDNEYRFSTRTDLTKEYEILYDDMLGERCSLIDIIKDICDGKVESLVFPRILDEETGKLVSSVFGQEYEIFKYLFSKTGALLKLVLL